MKKLNNKGFAISSLLYGLLLVAFLVVAVLMSIMASNRQNTSTLVDKIEEELNRQSISTAEYSYTGYTQEFVVPYGKAGWYKIELWGASAEDYEEDGHQGRGTYTSGLIYLAENEHLYIEVGEKGSTSSPGLAYNQIKSTIDGLGGATTVRLGGPRGASGSVLLMLAGGGGAKYSNYEGISKDKQGGNLHDSAHSRYNAGGSFIPGYGGQSNGGNTYNGREYSFTNGIMFHAVNAGDGWARIELVSENPSTIQPQLKSNILRNVTEVKDCLTMSSMTTKSGGKLNNGYELWQEARYINTLGKNVATISATEASVTPSALGTKISDGSLIQKIELISSNRYEDWASTTYCMTIKFNQKYDLYNFSLAHYYYSKYPNTEGTDFYTEIKEEVIYIKYSGSSTFTPVKTYKYTEAYTPYTLINDYYYYQTDPVNKANGAKYDTIISDNHIDNVSSISNGNYYITLAADEGRVLTATSNESSQNASQLNFYSGSLQQMWAITKLAANSSDAKSTGIYKLVEAEDGLALQPRDTDYLGYAENGTPVSTKTRYSSNSWEGWDIIHQYDSSGNVIGNEYYMIRARKSNSSGQSISTNQCLTAVAIDEKATMVLQDCDPNNKLQQFKLYNADY